MWFLANNYLFNTSEPKEKERVKLKSFNRPTKLDSSLPVMNSALKCLYDDVCFVSADVVASFTLQIEENNDIEITCHFLEQTKDLFAVVEVRKTGESLYFVIDVQVPILENDTKSIDAAWRSGDNMVYVFRGDTFIVFNYWLTGSKLTLSVTGNGYLGSFGIYEQSIDAVATINRKGYFFVSGWFYEIDELKKTNKQLIKKFALTDFFDAEDYCYTHDKTTFDNLKQRYAIWGQQTTHKTIAKYSSTSTEHTTAKYPSTATKTKSGTYALILLVVLLAAATICCMVFYYKHKSQEQQVKTGLQNQKLKNFNISRGPTQTSQEAKSVEVDYETNTFPSHEHSVVRTKSSTESPVANLNLKPKHKIMAKKA
ncbi:hypothetical protein B4U80_13313 [Leptotrombidium deliense]|uniref:Uncharacterized protein n=1 Tax=Leptotrombidium deliense TaxID=299467 RepID=A0A443S8I4_9ACAR|nr:hypothetical protein B4U80_13313 [Leptotrombidium deliense]